MTKTEWLIVKPKGKNSILLNTECIKFIQKHDEFGTFISLTDGSSIFVEEQLSIVINRLLMTPYNDLIMLKLEGGSMNNEAN